MRFFSRRAIATCPSQKGPTGYLPSGFLLTVADLTTHAPPLSKIGGGGISPTLALKALIKPIEEG